MAGIEWTSSKSGGSGSRPIPTTISESITHHKNFHDISNKEELFEFTRTINFIPLRRRSNKQSTLPFPSAWMECINFVEFTATNTGPDKFATVKKCFLIELLANVLYAKLSKSHILSLNKTLKITLFSTLWWYHNVSTAHW